MHFNWPSLSLPPTSPLPTLPRLCVLCSVWWPADSDRSRVRAWVWLSSGLSHSSHVLASSYRLLSPSPPPSHCPALSEHTASILGVRTNQDQIVYILQNWVHHLSISQLTLVSSYQHDKLWVSWRLNSLLLIVHCTRAADLWFAPFVSLWIYINRATCMYCSMVEDRLDKARARALEGIFCWSIWLTGKTNYLCFIALP